MRSQLYKSHFFKFQVRLIKEVSVSLMGNPNLMDPLNETRSSLLGCSFDVAEKDPEFILKVINDIPIYYVTCIDSTIFFNLDEHCENNIRFLFR